MILSAEFAPDHLERLYLDGRLDDPLQEVLRTDQIEADQLADLVFRDGRLRLMGGLPIEVDRYLRLIPGLASKESALDAAISVTIKGMLADGLDLTEAEATLTDNYPALGRAIREAVVLERAFASTTSGSAGTPTSLPAVPGYFGPQIVGGRQRYRLIRELGRGSSAVVVLAEDLHLSAAGSPAPLVAIKIGRHRSEGPSDRYEIASEAARARAIDHPNVIRVFDRGQTPDGADYLVVEYAPGGTLRSQFNAGKGGSGPNGIGDHARRTIEIGIGVAKGLQAIHLAGLVHRDLKPDNILIGADGTPKIADFGIALPVPHAEAVSECGADSPSLRGSLAFMAPERVRCEPNCNSVRADIYSLGAMLLHLLTGRLINGESVTAICRNAWFSPSPNHARLTDRPVARSSDRTLELILDRCIATIPAQRYQSAAEVAKDLERCEQLRPIEWIHTSRASRSRLWVRRSPMMACLAVLAALALVGAVAGATIATAARAREEARATKMQRALEQGIAVIESTKGRGKGSLAACLTQVMAVDWMRSQSLVLQDSEGGFLLGNRIAIVDEWIRESESRGRGDDLVTWQWRLAKGYWQLRSAAQTPKEPGLLAAVHAAFQRKLGDGESLTRVSLALSHCDEHNQLFLRALDTPLDSAQDLASLQRLRDQLQAALCEFQSAGQDDPLVETIAKTLSRQPKTR